MTETYLIKYYGIWNKRQLSYFYVGTMYLFIYCQICKLNYYVTANPNNHDGGSTQTMSKGDNESSKTVDVYVSGIFRNNSIICSISAVPH